MRANILAIYVPFVGALVKLVMCFELEYGEKRARQLLESVQVIRLQFIGRGVEKRDRKRDRTDHRSGNEWKPARTAQGE